MTEKKQRRKETWKDEEKEEIKDRNGEERQRKMMWKTEGEENIIIIEKIKETGKQKIEKNKEEDET